MSSKATLACDVDSTVWDLATPVREATLDITGDALDLGTVATWAQVLDRYGEEATAEIFFRVLSPERVPNASPTPAPPRRCRCSSKSAA